MVVTLDAKLLDKAGQRMPIADSHIAATARRHGLTIVTGNDRDFSKHPDIHYEAVLAAGTWEVDAAWPHVAAVDEAMAMADDLSDEDKDEDEDLDDEDGFPQ
jgi:hypothetical protein